MSATWLTLREKARLSELILNFKKTTESDVSDLLPTEGTAVVAFSDPSFDAFGMVQVSFVANQRCYLIVCYKVCPANSALGLQVPEL